VSPDQRSAAASIMMRNSNVRKPTAGFGHGSLYQLWNSLKPYDSELFGGTAQLDDVGFHIYFTLIAWTTVVIAGLSSEVFVGLTLIHQLLEHDLGVVIWHLSQMVSALCLTVAFFSDTAFGLPFLAAGLWKFGFPETITCLLLFYKNTLKIDSLIDGMGTLLHHLSTSLTITGIMCHLFPRSRAIIAACVVPIMQHWFVLVKYSQPTVYLVLELLLEAWFEWEVITNIGEFHSPLGVVVTRMGRSCALTMLLAHWLYLTAATIRLVRGCRAGLSLEDEAEAEAHRGSISDMRSNRTAFGMPDSSEPIAPPKCNEYV